MSDRNDEEFEMLDEYDFSHGERGKYSARCRDEPVQQIIVISDGPAGRRAVVAGTGLDVWEIVAAWRSMDEDFGRLRAGYPWLTEPQLHAALSYYRLYPNEIDARLEREASWTPERVRRKLPFATPESRSRR